MPRRLNKTWLVVAVSVVAIGTSVRASGQGLLNLRPDQPAWPAAADSVTSEQVQQAIAKSTAYLRSKLLGPDGEWAVTAVLRAQGVDYTVEGTVALCTLALLHAGVPVNDPAVRIGLRAIEWIPNEHTYVTGIKCQVLAIVVKDNKAYAKPLQEAATALARGQLLTGMWTYKLGIQAGGRGDNSNTQFALLGLHEAARAGAVVDKNVWTRSRNHFVNTQLPDGGWGYTYTAPPRGVRGAAGGSPATISMTCAGTSSLFICGERLFAPGRAVLNKGVYRECGKYAQYKPIADGLKWLAKTVNDPGANRQNLWEYYTLYGMERVGMIGGLRNFGSTDWYRVGAASLVSRQMRDGSWGGGGSLYNDSFALLFLSKGSRPVLIQKLEWNGTWNRNRNDLENLTAWLDEKLGKKVTWQTVSLAAPVEELRQAPILYITGHEFPVLTEAERAKLRRFVDTGGTLLCEACCGSAEFDKGFREFLAEAFNEYKLRKLDKSHPVFNTLHDLAATYDLHGVDVGCRTGVIYSPRALSPLWELRQAVDDTDKTVTSEMAYRLGGNIAAYATGREKLGDKLDHVELPAAATDAKPEQEIPRGAVRLARLAHSGDHDCDVHALSTLAAMLRDQANIDVVAQEKELRPDDPRLFGYPVCFITGHHEFTLTEKETAALKLYVQRGGVLIAEPCCGQKGFEESFRALMKSMFPEHELTPLPAKHPVYTGEVGVELGELRYRQVLADELNSRGTTRPPVEAVTLDGRSCVLFSPYDFTCGLEGDNPFNCRGYTNDDAKKLAFNLFLYAISR